jgi:hypothetical protein
VSVNPRSSRYTRSIRHGHHRADSQGHVLTHILVAESALGKPLPVGAEVHHVDEDTKNNRPSNLVICQDVAYHKLLHVRARIVRAGGNPNTDSICSTCGLVKPLDQFNRANHHKAQRVQRSCRQCQSDYCKSYIRKPKRAA